MRIVKKISAILRSSRLQQHQQDSVTDSTGLDHLTISNLSTYRP